MKRLSVSAIALSGLLFADSGAFAAQLSPLVAGGIGSYNNSPTLIADGNIPGEFTDWTNGQNVWWEGTGVELYIDFGSIHSITDVLVSVDNNDDYLIEWGGSTWTPLFAISSSHGNVWYGMDTMSTDSNHPEYIADLDFAPVQTQFLRIRATGGDNLYSVGEIQAFGSPVPVPAAVWLLSSGLLGLMGLSRRTQA